MSEKIKNNQENKEEIENNKEINKEKIVPKILEKEMESSYLDYAMSVIVGRALPDVRDGLKPVHRRILYAMFELSNTHDKPYKKSARIVGETLGKYHPHGDIAIYDALVRMAQDFSMRYPLIDGQGNFGSIDGDSAAAMRYTEVRLNKISEEMLLDIEKDTVDFVPNFDATLKEPTVLPSKFPNLLINGSSGIAVGMATNIPPHNLGEVCDGLLALIENPNISVEELLNFIKGPDFPTGGFIVGMDGILESYKTGKGSIRLRGKAEIINSEKEKAKIVISELPFQVNKAEFVKMVAELARDKKIEGISDISDRSSREGIEIVIELKKDANPEAILNQLYTKTSLEVNFGVINLALVDNQPKVLTLLQLLNEFLLHRKNIIKRRCTFDLNVSKERKHIVEGLLVAVKKIDQIIPIIRNSKNPKEDLISTFSFSEKQAEAVLEMKIRKLSSLEVSKLEEENLQLEKTIAYLSEILSDEKKIFDVIKSELKDIKEKYADSRKTKIIPQDKDFEIEDLIPDEEVVVIITQNNYIKRVPISEYKTQGRGGKGIIGTEIREEDQIKDIIYSSTHDYLLFFTNKGVVHWLKVFKIPSLGRYSIGKPIVNLLEIENNEKISAWVRVREFKENEFLVMLTKNGIVKKTSMIEFSRPRKGGIFAITLREGDELIDAKKTDGQRELILATKNGLAIRFKEDEIREVGRFGMGVIGIRLDENDSVVGLALNDKNSILTVTENGFGKRSLLSLYRLQSRGGKGVINIKTEGRNGKVVGILSVNDEDEFLLISSKGRAIRLKASELRLIGRNTEGVRLMKLDENEKVVAVEKVAFSLNV